VIASIIWRGIDALDTMAKLSNSEDNLIQVTEPISGDLRHITVGSSLPVTTLVELEREHRGDEAWTGLRKKIGKAFTGYFNHRVAFGSNDHVRAQLIIAQGRSQLI
jgi:hypothetical protein